MRFNALIQDGELQLMGENGVITFRPRIRIAPAAQAA